MGAARKARRSSNWKYWSIGNFEFAAKRLASPAPLGTKRIGVKPSAATSAIAVAAPSSFAYSALLLTYGTSMQRDWIGLDVLPTRAQDLKVKSLSINLEEADIRDSLLPQYPCQ